MGRTQRYYAKFRGDDPIEISNLSAFCRQHDLKVETARQVVAGREISHRGWKFRRADDGPFPENEPAATVIPADAPLEIKEMFAEGATPEQMLLDMRRYAAEIMRLDVQYTTRIEGPPDGWNAKQRLETLNGFAKMSGIDPKKIGDTRDAGDKAQDAATKVIGIGGGEMLALLEDELDAMELGIERCRTLSKEEMSTLNEAARGVSRGRLLGGEDPNAGEIADPKAWAEAADRWINCIRRIRTLRRMATLPYDPHLGGWTEVTQRGTHLLRFMLYVGRSDMGGSTPADRVFKIGKPQIKMSMAIYLSRAGYAAVEGVGLLAPGDRNPISNTIFPGLLYSGVIIMAPPRHGKSDTIKHDCVLEINQNPMEQSAYTTATDPMGETMLNSCAEYFSVTSAQGRRNLSLYPCELADYDNNKNNLRIKTINTTRQPQLIGHGIFTKRQGINLGKLVCDDPVNTDDKQSASVRENRIAAFKGTWQTRLQGDRPFTIMAGYPHHFDDLMWKTKQRADLGARTANAQGVTMWQCIMSVGGPQSSPPFRAIWPEMYDSAFLARKYREINDPSMWAANYQCRPITDADRLVRSLALYDSDSPEHVDFLSRAMFYMGADPAAKGDGTGDKAGVVMGAEGDAVWERRTPEGLIGESETQLRIIVEDEFHATQMELSERLLQYGSSQRLDMVYIEQVTGLGSAMVEVLREIYGVTAVQTEGVKNLNKEARLRSIAPLLENGSAGLRAKVLFPGVKKVDSDTGTETLVLHPSMERIANYILNFAVTSGHHSLDALTLLVRKRMPYLGAGTGVFSQQAKAASHGYVNPGIKKLFEKARQSRSPVGGVRRAIIHSGV
jgi:hypothetical protein